jgi:hypothetical protein
MHKELTKDGLVVMSLSIDEVDNKDAVLEFLKKMDARFPNFLLVDTDENHDKNQKDFPTNTPPLTHVFDQTGKKVKTFTGDEKPEEVEEFVRELLKKE